MPDFFDEFSPAAQEPLLTPADLAAHEERRREIERAAERQRHLDRFRRHDRLARGMLRRLRTGEAGGRNARSTFATLDGRVKEARAELHAADALGEVADETFLRLMDLEHRVVMGEAWADDWLKRNGYSLRRGGGA